MPKSVEVNLFIPCFIDQIYPNTAVNTVKLLENLGCTVHYDPNQSCCGQPAYNAGYFDEAGPVAQKFLNDFDNNRYIVSPSSSCTGMVTNAYGQLLGDACNRTQLQRVQKKMFELTQFITEILEVEKIEGAELSGTAVYHDSCSALRECGIREAPRKLLQHVKGLNLVPFDHAETCCGFGGTFSVKFEAISCAMADQKLENIHKSGAEYVISADSSCLLQLESYAEKQGSNLKFMHIADVLASGL